jgi:hypothetical protein
VAARRPSLEVVTPRPRRARRSLTPVLSAAIVSASLLLVVLGHAELAQGQVRLANVQSEITSARLLHERDVLGVSQLENPSRILGVAERTLHMAPPAQVHQLVPVSLGTTLPVPHLVTSAASSSSSTRSAAGQAASGG